MNFTETNLSVAQPCYGLQAELLLRGAPGKEIHASEVFTYHKGLLRDTVNDARPPVDQ